MCDVISFATPLDGFRERGFVGVTHGPIGLWCSQKLLRHTSFLLGAIHKGRPQLGGEGGSAKSGHVRTGGGLGQNEDVLKKSQFSTILW